MGIQPGHEKMCLTSYANNKGADQPAHPRSLISASVVRCLDSIISIDSIPYCYLFLLSVFRLWFSYYVSDIFCKF